MTFGEKVREARKVLDLGVGELAHEVGVSERTIYSYENKGAHPRGRTLEKLAQALYVSATYLINEDETNKDKNKEQEDFVKEVREQFGSKGARKAADVLERTTALFAGGDIDDDDKELVFRSIMKVFLNSKAEAREKYGRKSGSA